MMSTSAKIGRSPLSITVSVWRALFLREAVHRLFGSRGAWLWLLLEPIVHVVFLVVVFSMVRMRELGGIDTGVWLIVGLTAYFMFKRAGTQGMNAIAANQALFTYRQVLPVDTVLSRVLLEGMLMTLVTVVLLLGGGLIGLPVMPPDTLAVVEAFWGLWLLGAGFALVTSVIRELVAEAGQIINLLMTPLYFISGAIFPMTLLPPSLREVLMLNPLAHALEAARLGFAPHYYAAPETSMAYVYFSALVLIFLGLALHARYAERLISR